VTCKSGSCDAFASSWGSPEERKVLYNWNKTSHDPILTHPNLLCVLRELGARVGADEQRVQTFFRVEPEGCACVDEFLPHELVLFGRAISQINVVRLCDGSYAGNPVLKLRIPREIFLNLGQEWRVGWKLVCLFRSDWFFYHVLITTLSGGGPVTMTRIKKRYKDTTNS
jgi:hypothetical protein